MSSHDRDDACDTRIAALTGTVEALEQRITEKLQRVNERLDAIEARAADGDRAT